MIAARAFLFILLVLMGLTLAHSEGFTGIDLYKVCADPRADSVCIAYVRGLSEGYYEGLYIGRSLERAHQTPCFPQPPKENTPDPTQAELIVKKYMTDHPEKLNEPALFVVREALEKAFSCPK